MHAAAAEQHLEGGFWLLHVDSEAFAVPENLVHSTSKYEAGWWCAAGGLACISAPPAAAS